MQVPPPETQFEWSDWLKIISQFQTILKKNICENFSCSQSIIEVVETTSWYLPPWTGLFDPISRAWKPKLNLTWTWTNIDIQVMNWIRWTQGFKTSHDKIKLTHLNPNTTNNLIRALLFCNTNVTNVCLSKVLFLVSYVTKYINNCFFLWSGTGHKIIETVAFVLDIINRLGNLCCTYVISYLLHFWFVLC